MFVARIDTDNAAPLTGGLPATTMSFAALADQVHNRMGGLEDAFRETGETLANAIGTIDGMAQGLSSIRQDLSHDTAGVAVSRLRDVAYRGEAWVALVETAGGRVVRAVVPGNGAAPPAPGAGVELAWDDDANIALGDD